jgi:hypothetical protein
MTNVNTGILHDTAASLLANLQQLTITSVLGTPQSFEHTYNLESLLICEFQAHTYNLESLLCPAAWGFVDLL